MRSILESVAAKAATGWQRAGSKFDFEVFSMPGGSVLAPALWAYSVAVSALKSSRQHSVDQQPATDTAAAERTSGAQAAQSKTGSSPAQSKSGSSSEIGLSCAWPRCHCT